MKRLLVILLLAAALPAAASGPPGAGAGRTVRYGVVPVEPLVFRLDGRAAGLCVDLVAEVAAREGWTLEYSFGTWDEQVDAVARGELDLLAPAGWSAGRDSLLDFTRRPILTLWSQVYVPRGSAARTVVDLADRTVAVMRGDLNAEHFRRYCERFGVACRLVEEPSLQAVFARVAEGRADAGVAPNVFGTAHAAEFGLEGTAIIFEPFTVHYVVPEGRNADLLAALDRALGTWQDGDASYYRDRVDHWFGGGDFRLREVPPWLLAAAAGIVAVALVLATWNRLLNREVRRRTRALRRSEERFRAIFDNNFQMTGLLDPAGAMLEANPAALAAVGATPGDVLGRPFWETPWWSHDADLQERLRRGVREAAAGGFVRFEATHPAPDGSLRLVDFSLKPAYDDDGRLIYLLPEGRDVTDQRHGEIRYRNLFESAGDAIFVMDRDRFVECNARTLELFRCTREEILGRFPSAFSPPVQPDGRPSAVGVREHLDRARHRRVHTFEWRHRRGDGTDFDADVTLTAYTAAGVPYVLAIVRDVTARRRLEADLRQAHKMEAIGTLAGGIAHDFNNILAAILGFGELARFRAEGDPEQLRSIDQIMRAGERARDLVQQILAFSRKGGEGRRTVALTAVVEETLRLLRSSIPRTVELRADLRDAGPVRADPTGLHQIVMNLCTNAYQALGGGGGQVAVTVREADGDRGAPGPGPWVVLEVRDDGPGMDAAVRAKIFEPYFTTKGSERGTGLGLAVVHGIVEELGGAVEVESAPGEGALFRVWLPRTGEATAAAVAPDAGAVGMGGRERILLVDDEPDIVKVAELGLGRYGYRVTGFTEAAAALDAFRAAPADWDVVVSDVTMPGLTGLALARALAAERPDLPVILCTGYSEALTPATAREAGVRATLMKPLTATRLAAEIRAVVDAGAPR